MITFDNVIQWILGSILIFSSVGVIVAQKPIHASLSFLLTLLTLATFYLELSSHFIAVLQVLVYAGAILVIFMFVIVLFQDAHEQLNQLEAKSPPFLLYFASSIFLLVLVFLGRQLIGLPNLDKEVARDFGTAESIGRALYVDFFFPFEAVILLFLIAVIGAVYVGKKVR